MARYTNFIINVIVLQSYDYRTKLLEISFVILAKLILSDVMFIIESDVTGIPPLVIVINVLKTSVYGYVFFLVAVGLTLSLICLLFNIIFRNRK